VSKKGWEYRVLVVEAENFEGVVDTLNAEGQEGWLVVALLGSDPALGTTLFLVVRPASLLIVN